MSKEKSRYFTFLLYPESVPDDWQMKLETLDVPIAISPLHDKDLSESNVNTVYKKAHWHLIYVAKNPVTADSIRVKIKRLLGEKSCNCVQIVERGMSSMYLYLTHESKDAIAKQKHVYDKKDIVLINNFDIERYVVLDETEKKRLRKLLCEIIRDNHIINVIELESFIFLRGAEYDETLTSSLHEILSGYTALFRLYFDANYQLGYKRIWTRANENN